MTFKVLQRDTCPKDWAIGYQIEWQGEVLELIEIEGDQYTWVDVRKLTPNPNLSLNSEVTLLQNK